MQESIWASCYFGEGRRVEIDGKRSDVIVVLVLVDTGIIIITKPKNISTSHQSYTLFIGFLSLAELVI